VVALPSSTQSTEVLDEAVEAIKRAFYGDTIDEEFAVEVVRAAAPVLHKQGADQERQRLKEALLEEAGYCKKRAAQEHEDASKADTAIERAEDTASAQVYESMARRLRERASFATQRNQARQEVSDEERERLIAHAQREQDAFRRSLAREVVACDGSGEFPAIDDTLAAENGTEPCPGCHRCIPATDTSKEGKPCLNVTHDQLDCSHLPESKRCKNCSPASSKEVQGDGE
jgi:hypothetical protein